MSKKRYRQPAGDRHSPADRHRSHSVPSALSARQACFRECYDRFAEFYGIAEYERVIRFYRETVEFHRKERALREQLLDDRRLENYRWQVAGTLAIRAAKALEQAQERLRELKEEAREAALRCVELKFGPDSAHDTAVTEGMAGLPPLLPEQREAEAPAARGNVQPRTISEPPLTPQQEQWLDKVAEQADAELAAASTDGSRGG